MAHCGDSDQHKCVNDVGSSRPSTFLPPHPVALQSPFKLQMEHRSFRTIPTRWRAELQDSPVRPCDDSRRNPASVRVLEPINRANALPFREIALHNSYARFERAPDPFVAYFSPLWQKKCGQIGRGLLLDDSVENTHRFVLSGSWRRLRSCESSHRCQ